jgi:hypothetical protein
MEIATDIPIRRVLRQISSTDIRFDFHEGGDCGTANASSASGGAT